MKPFFLLILLAVAAHAQQGAPASNAEKTAKKLELEALAPSTVKDLELKKLNTDLGEKWKGAELTTIKGSFGGYKDGDQIAIQTQSGESIMAELAKGSIVRDAKGKATPLDPKTLEALKASDKTLSLFQVAKKDGQVVLFRWHQTTREPEGPGKGPPLFGPKDPAGPGEVPSIVPKKGQGTTKPNE
jgi:hypothetical protein